MRRPAWEARAALGQQSTEWQTLGSGCKSHSRLLVSCPFPRGQSNKALGLGQSARLKIPVGGVPSPTVPGPRPQQTGICVRGPSPDERPASGPRLTGCCVTPRDTPRSGLSVGSPQNSPLTPAGPVTCNRAGDTTTHQSPSPSSCPGTSPGKCDLVTAPPASPTLTGM